MGFKVSKQVVATLKANPELAKSKGLGKREPLVGHRELKIVQAVDRNGSLSVNCTIADTPVRASLFFYNILNGEANEYTIKNFIKFLSCIDLSINESGEINGINTLDELEGRELSGIILARQSNNPDYPDNYEILSTSKSEQSSSLDWLKSIWDWNVIGVDNNGKKRDTEPYYAYSANISGAKKAFFSTAYDYNGEYDEEDTSDDTSSNKAPSKSSDEQLYAANVGSKFSEVEDNEIPF